MYEQIDQPRISLAPQKSNKISQLPIPKGKNLCKTEFEKGAAKNLSGPQMNRKSAQSATLPINYNLNKQGLAEEGGVESHLFLHHQFIADDSTNGVDSMEDLSTLSFITKDVFHQEETKKIQLLDQTTENNSKQSQEKSQDLFKINNVAIGDRYIPQRVHSNNQSIFEIS